ncbi:hypothetical protein LCGC14_1374120 [marine sediment metagenome]|uniref:Uncharacterized protein n=1 Tax=marine sediment metagenome TaxID=412755 RepID=A0A0F9K4K7_9ZZZZ
MEKVYWDEGKYQIVTKDGMCLYDKNIVAPATLNKYDMAILDRPILDKMAAERKEWLHESNNLKAQLVCSAKTQGKHKMVFKESTQGKLTVNDIRQAATSMALGWWKEKGPFIFECSVCGLGITKTVKELTTAEREGLKKLKLL